MNHYSMQEDGWIHLFQKDLKENERLNEVNSCYKENIISETLNELVQPLTIQTPKKVISPFKIGQRVARSYQSTEYIKSYYLQLHYLESTENRNQEEEEMYQMLINKEEIFIHQHTFIVMSYLIDGFVEVMGNEIEICRLDELTSLKEIKQKLLLDLLTA